MVNMNPAQIGVLPPGMEFRPKKQGSRGRPKTCIKPGSGKRIARLIKQRYGSQGKAAQAWGCSRQYVGMVCREEAVPSQVIVEDLSL